MAIDIILPELGENIEEGEVVNILIAVGDTVREEQPLMEVETGKATVEVPASAAGKVETLHVGVGDKVPVGALLISLAGDAPAEEATAPAPQPEPASAAEPEPAPAPEPPPPPPASTGPTLVEFAVPGLGENIEEGEVVGITVSVGDTIEPDTTVMEVETGKATVEVPTELNGTIKEVLVKAGDKIKVGQVVFKIEAEGAAPAPAAAPSAGSPAQAPTPAAPSAVPPSMPGRLDADLLPPPVPDSHVPVRAAPSVRKLARELGVQIGQVKPAAAKGRITVEDIKAHAKRIITEGPQTGARPAAPSLPDFSKFGPVERKKMSNIRRITADHMTTCWTTIPHVTQHDTADITKLEKLRKEYAKKAKDAGGKLTVTAILVKILASALRAFPDFNASVDMDANEIVYKDYVNIGLAVDTPKGLLVPVLHDADKKNIIELSVQITEIAVKARDGKVPPGDLQGGCFTITNLGGIGGSYFTPIINFPEVAILGVGRAKMEQLYVDGSFEPRLMMPLSLSYDHRVIDGASGARFLRWIREASSEPFVLALEG